MNMLDYLDWRGDLSFAAAPFNEVDALICAWLSYYEFDDLLHDADFHGDLSLHELGERQLKELGPAPRLNLNFTIDPSLSATLLLTKMYDTVRFRDMRLLRCRELFDEQAGVQFAAMSFAAENAPYIVAYRGTDTSLAGWKEDFELSFMEHVPAQALALQYLEAETLPRNTVICGHSKGGNLALYAALNGPAEKLRQVERIYNFDGPGFRAPMETMPRFDMIQSRIVTVVPESSVVGMLLDHPESYRVVKSDMVSIFQHNGMMWQVLGDHFVDAGQLNLSSVIVDKTMENWLDKMNLDERREAVKIVFTVLEGTGVRNFPDLTDHAVRNMLLMLKGVSHLSWPQKKLAARLILEMIKAGNVSAYETISHADFVAEWTEGRGRARRQAERES